MDISRLKDFDALTFDCYGTLIDWESGMVAGLEPLVARLDPRPSRDAILEAHAFQESTHQRQTPAKTYSDLLATVYRRIGEGWGLTPAWEACEAYGRSVPQWPAFADSAAALTALQRHCKLVILSNVDNRSFAGSRARLGVQFDAIYSAEDIGAYKPNDRNFEYMISQLAARGIAKGRVLHVAESLFHDHVPARRHGLATCWIYRRHDQQGFGATMDPGERPEVDFRFNSMADFAAAVARAHAG
jgi:2-haloalkanoic acid dehalogenase type II